MQRLIRRYLCILEPLIIKTGHIFIRIAIQYQYIRLEQLVFRMNAILQRFIYILIKLGVIIVE